MGKRGVYLILVVLVVAGVLVAVFAGREREPEYGGKKLSEWVLHQQQLLPSLTKTEVGPNPEAGDAIRQIGTNGLPYLIRWVRYERPPWKDRLFRELNPVISRVKNAWSLNDRGQQARADEAARALVLLGSQGEGAIPELTKMVNHRTRGHARSRAGFVLASLGDSGVRALLANNELPWNDVREFLDAVGTNVQPAIGAFKEALKSPDVNVRSIAASVLEKIESGRWEEVGP